MRFSLLFEPQSGELTLAVISYKAGLGCVLPLNNPVTGAVVALVDKLEASIQLMKFSEAIQLLNSDELSFGGNKSYLDGHAEATLTGKHKGTIGIH